MNRIKRFSLVMLVLSAIAMSACKKEDDAAPAEENDEEIITDVKLIFTNSADKDDIVEARAQDPDGAGVQELKILDEINLDTSKTYVLTLEVMNNLTDPGESIGDEIEEENDEHQLYFSFSNDAFSNPLGDGNIDDYADDVRYNDTDANGNPVGLSTTWTTSSTPLTGGTFTIRLQHQPDIKSATSEATDGDTDFELTFVLNIN